MFVFNAILFIKRETLPELIFALKKYCAIQYQLMEPERSSIIENTIYSLEECLKKIMNQTSVFDVLTFL